MEKLKVSQSPHIKSSNSTKKIMLDVIIALCPALIMGVVFFGLYALVIVLLAIGSCVLGEFLFNKIVKRPQTICDLSAVVTGLILGLNLPGAVPFYVPIVGGFFAIMVVKMLFGGLGKNFANPAAVARVFLLLTWAGQMTTYVAPLSFAGNNVMSELTKYFTGFVNSNDLVTSATPLSGSSAVLNPLYLFLGNVAGCIGETSAAALLAGGIYLVVRKVIDWKIPVIIIGSFVIFTLLFGGTYLDLLPQMLSGGLMIGAIFMATDYVTSPNTKGGVIIYSLLIGLVTVVIRKYTSMPEGMSYAIVFANLVAPLLDKYIIPAPYGVDKKPVLMISLASVMTALVVAFAVCLPINMTNVNNTIEENGDIIISSVEDGVSTYIVKGYGTYNDDPDQKERYVQLTVEIKDFRIVGVEYMNADFTSGFAGHSQEYLDTFVGLDLRLFNQDSCDVATGSTGSSLAVFNALNSVYLDYLGGGN